MAASRTRALPESASDGRFEAILDAAGVGAGSRLGVALSGGVDSVLALHLLVALRERRGFELRAAHVDHGLQPQAGEWATFCRRLCAALDVRFDAFDVRVRRDHPDGLEAAAREARHAALATLPVDWLVFGHHLDDQAETVLFRLLRGAGVRGAGAMAPVEPGAPGRLRPLLEWRRARILAAARGMGLEWIEDPSNADLRHARNRLRHDVLPRLEAAAPGAVPMLARAALNFREADGLLDELAHQDALACGDGDRFSLAALRALSEPRLRNLLRWRIRCSGADAPSRARLVEAVRQVRGAVSPTLHLPLGQVACCVHRGRVWIEPLPASRRPQPVAWRGESELPWGDGRVVFESRRGEGLRLALLDGADVVLGPRRAGVRMADAPGRPRHSFKNLCQEAGVPPWWREHLPVLYVAGEPVWIAGVGIAPDARCRAGEAGMMPAWWRSGAALRD
jgi:tRNA(Ile)-lysidine synthase